MKNLRLKSARWTALPGGDMNVSGVRFNSIITAAVFRASWISLNCFHGGIKLFMANISSLIVSCIMFHTMIDEILFSIE